MTSHCHSVSALRVQQPRRGRRLLGILGLSASLSLVPIAASASAHSSRAAVQPASSSNPLQQGLKFYRGKQLTFVITGVVGSSEDLLVRDLIPYIASYLHASINIESLGQSQGVPGSDTLASATPNGLTMGEISITHILISQLTNTSGYNFNPERLAWLGQAGASVSVLIAKPSSPYTSFAMIKHSPTPVTMLTLAPPGISNADLRLFMATFGIKPNYIGAYNSLATLEQGYTRGDGPIAYGALANYGPFIQGGIARPLAYTTLPPVGTQYRQYLVGLPSYTQLLKEYPPTKTVKKLIPAIEDFLLGGAVTLFTQTGVAGYKDVALRAAVSYAFHRPGFKSLALSQGDNTEFIPGQVGKQQYIAGLTQGKVLVCYLQSTC